MAYLRKTMFSLGGPTPVGASPFQEALQFAAFQRAAAPRGFAASQGRGSADDDAERLAIAQMREQGVNAREAARLGLEQKRMEAQGERADQDRAFRRAIAESQERNRALRDETAAERFERSMAMRENEMANTQKWRGDQITEREKDRGAREGREAKRAAETARAEGIKANEQIGVDAAGARRKIAKGEEPLNGPELIDQASIRIANMRDPEQRAVALAELEAFARALDKFKARKNAPTDKGGTSLLEEAGWAAVPSKVTGNLGSMAMFLPRLAAGAVGPLADATGLTNREAAPGSWEEWIRTAPWAPFMPGANLAGPVPAGLEQENPHQQQIAELLAGLRARDPEGMAAWARAKQNRK